VISCARCGQDHEVEFKKFQRPIEDSDSTVWTHWGICPNTDEPILLKMSETDG
jgi:hypothetical protein